MVRRPLEERVRRLEILMYFLLGVEITAHPGFVAALQAFSKVAMAATGSPN